jgi:hypothetical protein
MASLHDYVQQVSDTATQRALDAVLSAIRTDLTLLVVAVAGITAQLDADTGVADADYAATNNSTLTLTE